MRLERLKHLFKPTSERVNPFIHPTGNTDQLLAAITPNNSFVAETTEMKIGG